MRLIDADELKELYEDYEGLKVPCEVVLQNIDDMPTAYDIDEKVGKLEKTHRRECGLSKSHSRGERLYQGNPRFYRDSERRCGV